MTRRAVAVTLLAILVAGCSGPIFANPPLVPVAPATPTAGPARPPDPIPISFPRDDGPHDRLTEWWYYTGHLRDGEGARWGFEFVIFRAERGHFPITWASHVALTDETAGRFVDDQRSEIGPQVDVSPDSGLDLIVGPSPTLADAWRMQSIEAIKYHVAAQSAEFGIRLDLVDTRPAPVLHRGNGWVDFGPAGGSYYYSRPRMTASGTLTLGQWPQRQELAVEGTAWFDHQWGDFISVGGGGWDWFAVNLDDGTDLTISLVRAADGSYPLVYGTIVDADGRATHLDRGDFELEADPSRTWTSPSTGATYPAGWTIRVPGQALVIDLEPTVAGQELDTRPTTGVVYWEGSQVVRATRNGRPVGGEAYVELTGYAPAGQ